ncbi:class A beta-lactamase-related serine hydrolase [Akkermansiaceae bacterium]|nr:class A beta-lactamase-related serine hydrolase [Akkermansiaceae bacterium]
MIPFPSKRRTLSLLPILILALGLAPLNWSLAGVGSELEGEIETYVKSLRQNGYIRGDERTAWVVYDITSNTKLASINEDASLQAASMIKPYVALAFFHQVRAGKLQYGQTSRRHMELMIQKSSNTSTNWVMRQTGGPAATQALLKRHYPSLCKQIHLVEYIPDGGRTYRNRLSAGDYVRFLTAMWKEQIPSSGEMKRLMALPGRDRLYSSAKRVPTGTQVYNKTGSTAMCCGDMGILVARGSDGRPYPYILVGIIESGSRSKSYGPWIKSRGNVIREVSNKSYLAMKERYSL